MNMKTLETNAINVWGENGKSWLNQLPGIIKQLSDYWSLRGIQPIDNMSYNYVAKAVQNDQLPVVLKISCDKQLIENESRALKSFNGQGSVRMLDMHHELNALLLEQAIPGNLLKSDYPGNIKNTIKVYASVVNALASCPEPSDEHTHVSKWCEALDRINDDQIRPHFIRKAKVLRDFLLSSATTEYLCHADLHLENIINHGNRWLSIDPKGIIGEMAFEAAAFDFIDQNEWSEPDTIQDKMITRVSLLANVLAIDQERLFAWVFLRAIISAQWFIEDNGDPAEMLNLGSVIDPLLTRPSVSEAAHKPEIKVDELTFKNAYPMI
ncbi:aminoglycoside phosphotransferase family protein [Coxiella burnetii]